MDVLTLANLLPYTLQVCCLAALATVVALTIRVDAASVRHAYWRLVLAASVLWPFLQPAAATSKAAASVTASAASVTTTLGPAGPIAAGQAPFDWTPMLLTILIVGMGARLVRVAAGAISLQRLRGFGVSATDDPHVVALQQTLGTHADVRIVADLEQPATFGVLRPVVLLPGTIHEHPVEIRRALIAHELLHVQRRDWVWVVGEELLLAFCWFNPATWWIVAQVRRSREEAVDELAVLVTGSRRTYVKALLAFAGDTSLAPAPAFAHRRHLFRRILLLSTEAAMSSSRIVLSGAAMALILVGGTWYTAAAFPLVAGAASYQSQGPGALEQRARAASADNPPPKRTDYQAPEYPAEARALGASGVVGLRVTINDVGLVGEVRRTRITVSLTDPAVSMALDDASPETLESFKKAVLRDKSGRVVDTTTMLRAADALTESAIAAVRNWRYEAPVNGPITFDVRIHFQADGETSTSQNTGTVGLPLKSSLSAYGAVRVGGNIKAPIKITDVRPVYPPVAQQARVSGMVIIEAVIGRDGSVEAAQVLRSIPLLDQAALDAVHQWKFTPTYLNGAAVPVIMTVTVNFSLQ